MSAENPRSPHADDEAAGNAFLLRAWAEAEPAVDPDDVPDEVWGLLDGTITGAEADAVRERISRDPRLAKAAGALLVELDELRAHPPVPRDPPGRLLSGAIEGGTRRAPNTDASLRERVRSWIGVPAWSGLAAAAAAILVVALFLRDPWFESRQGALRGTEASLETPRLTAPADGTRLAGNVELRWEALPNAVRYRVVLADISQGTLFELPITTQTRLLIESEVLRAFAPSEREIHWTVHARLRDGTETSSSPGRFRWSSSD